MAPKNPQAVAEKYARHATGAQQDYIAGVQAVTESPTAKAARNLNKAAANYQDAVSSGRMAKRLNAVTLEDWRKNTVELGGGRYTSGVQAGQKKMEKFMTDFLPVVAAAQAKVDAMPSNTLEDNIARSAAMQRELAKFKNR